MSTDATKTTAKGSMEKALTALSDALKKVRTGRAQISMLDNVRVNYYLIFVFNNSLIKNG